MKKQDISTRNGVTWIGFAQAGKILMQLVSILALARLLPPEDFGLMAMAATATAFATLVRDMGTGAAVIQKDKVSDELTSAVFFFNILVGFLLSAILIVSSKWLGEAFSDHRLASVLMLLSPVFTFSALGAVHQALLERGSNFKTLAYVEVASSFLGLLTALIVASYDGGVFALVAQSLAAAIFATAFLWAASPWRPKISLNMGSLGEIFSFSGNIFLFNFMNYFHRNSDSMLIGRFLGSGELGIYNIAYRVILFPLQNITFVIGRAAFPVYSRSQKNSAAIGRHYLAMLGIVAFITAPLMGLSWAIREPLISLLLGDRWLRAAEVLAWLAPVGFFQSMVSTSGSVLNSIGRSDVLRNLGLIGTILLVGSIIIGLQWGVIGVSASYCIANLLWIYPVLSTVLHKLDMRFRDFVEVILRPVLLAVIVALAARALSLQPLIIEQSSVFKVFICGLFYLFSYLALYKVLWPNLLNEILRSRVAE